MALRHQNKNKLSHTRDILLVSHWFTSSIVLIDLVAFFPCQEIKKHI